LYTNFICISCIHDVDELFVTAMVWKKLLGLRSEFGRQLKKEKLCALSCQSTCKTRLPLIFVECSKRSRMRAHENLVACCSVSCSYRARIAIVIGPLERGSSADDGRKSVTAPLRYAAVAATAAAAAAPSVCRCSRRLDSTRSYRLHGSVPTFHIFCREHCVVHL